MRSFNPSVAWLTVNRRCDFRCRWCYAKATEYETDSDISIDLAKTLALAAKGAGARKILLIGGEPLLWGALIEFNAFCADEGLETILVSNGARFASDDFWERYREQPNDIIGISVKATSPQELIEVAGVTNFLRVEKGLKRAISGLSAHVNITYSSFSAPHLVDMVRTVTEWGASSVKVEFCSTTFAEGKPSSEFMVPPEDLVAHLVRVFPDLQRITEGRIVLDMMLPLCLWPEEFVRELYEAGRMLSVCHVHKRKGIIFDGDGKVIMCNALFDYPLGQFGADFHDGETLLEWLNSPKVLRYYDRIGSYPSLVCKDCAWYAECGGGCPLKWATYHPDDIVQPRNRPLGHA